MQNVKKCDVTELNTRNRKKVIDIVVAPAQIRSRETRAVSRPCQESTMNEPNRPKDLPDGDAPSQSRRTILKAGWVAPVIVALSLPAVSFDANASGQVVPVQPPRVTLPPQPPWWWPRSWPWPPWGG
jgi:hypothetical protein